VNNSYPLLIRVEKFIWYLVVFFLPFQAGLHLWPDFAFVSGIRVDYLSPTIHITDILIFILFALILLQRRVKVKDIKKILPTDHLSSRLALVALFSVLLSVWYAYSPGAALFGLLKIAEFLFFGLYTSFFFKKEDIERFIDLFFLNTIIVCSLAIAQFLRQASLGGIFYFLGERTFTSSTPGIANMDLGGTLILRPYSTFPHPNVLAFFLFFVGIVFLYRIIFLLKKGINIDFFLLCFVFFLISFTLLITFSRLTIILYALFLIFISYSEFFIKLKPSRKMLSLVLFTAFLFVFLLLSRNTILLRFTSVDDLSKAFLLRNELLNTAWLLFQQHPFFGVGPKNLFFYEALYQKSISPTLLQPVHNIYVLTLVEAGIFVFLFFLIFLIRCAVFSLRNLKRINNMEYHLFYKSILFTFFGILIVGFFDHFFLTLQQGSLILTLVISILWAKEFSKSKVVSNI
jgi:O-antigen ligase